MDKKDRKALLEKAHSVIVLSLKDKVLRHVLKEKTAARLWIKLEILYMTKSLVNNLYLKQTLYSYNMSNEKTISEEVQSAIS